MPMNGLRLALALGAMLLLSPPVVAASDDDFATNARLLASIRNEDAAGVERALRDGAARELTQSARRIRRC